MANNNLSKRFAGFKKFYPATARAIAKVSSGDPALLCAMLFAGCKSVPRSVEAHLTRVFKAECKRQDQKFAKLMAV